MEIIHTPKTPARKLVPVSPLADRAITLPVEIIPSRLKQILQAGAQAQDLLAQWEEADTQATVASACAHDDHAESLGLVLAQTLERAGQAGRAIDALEEILAVRNCFSLLSECARLTCQVYGHGRAMTVRERALTLKPLDVVMTRDYAFDLMDVGRMEDGLAVLQNYMKRCPDNAWMHTILLLFTHYQPNYDRQALLEEHQRWARLHAPVSRMRHCHPNVPDPQRRLRIGYVSPDFFTHVVMYNFAVLLRHHRRDQFELYGYGSVRRPDETTERLCREFDHFQLVHDLDGRQLADQIEADGIDILIEVAGLVGGNRLDALSYKPAPIQVDFQGIDTTGMEQMDYRFSDVVLDTEDNERFYVEKTVFLSRGVHCYTPRKQTPPQTPPPCLERGYLTFGSFNANLKLNPWMVGLWSRILQQVPNAHMLIKMQHMEPDTLPTIKGWFNRAGIGDERLSFCGGINTDHQHLAVFNQVDVVLDSSPYSGCITTLEALWMGVPVLTLAGNRLVARAGASILHHAGLDFLVAESPDEYVAKGVSLAGKPEALAQIRAGLRAKLRSSSLMDGPGYVREIEAAYRWMWQRWCEKAVTPD